MKMNKHEEAAYDHIYMAVDDMKASLNDFDFEASGDFEVPTILEKTAWIIKKLIDIADALDERNADEDDDD